MIIRESTLQRMGPEELEKAYKQYGACIRRSELGATSVPLGMIKTAPKVFQCRQMENQTFRKQRHIEQLARAVEAHDQLLDPILLFPVVGYRLVVDGHCRLRAYHEAGLPTSREVPAEYFTGTFSDALVKAASSNSKDKLPLSTEEKLEAAWRLVLFNEERGCYSYREIAQSSGVSSSTVGNMNAVLDEHLGFDPRLETWKNVKRLKRGSVGVTTGFEDRLANDWACRLRKEFGKKPDNQKEVFFGALEIAYPQLFPEAIPSHWAERAEEALMERREEEAAF